MVTLRLALNQIAREFPALREGVIVSDKCSSFQTYEQIVFVIQGNNDGWATTEYPIPTPIRIVAWQHTESQAGKDTLDTHYAFLSLAHEKYLRFNGDIINPTDMFNATSKYAPINTSVILANTSHAPIRKFTVPTLKVRQVHSYVYLQNGDVEVYHHTGVKKPGMYEKMHFNKPLPLDDKADPHERQMHRVAEKNYKKIIDWFASNKPVITPGTVHEVYTPVYNLSGKANKPEPRNVYKTKESAGTYEAMVAKIALDFATVSQDDAEALAQQSMMATEPEEAVESTYIGGYKR
jgi:hypothetical protein